MTRRPNVTYSAPVLSVDLAADGYQIWPCHDCLPWHAEVVAEEDGYIAVREWHAAECPTLAEVLRAIAGQEGAG
jgi:hypothetical protein